MTDTPALRAVKKARTALLTGKPQGRGAFFGALAMRLEIEESRKIDAPMSTNGRVLRFHPEMIDKLSSDHLMSLVTHEILHCSLGHHTRRGKRDPKMWNVATDHAVNIELEKSGFAMHPDAVMDKRFDGMSAERIYTILETEQPPPPSGGQGQKGQGGGKGEKQPQWAGVVEDAPGDKEKQDGEGDGEDGDDDDDQGDGLSEAEARAERREWEMATIQAAAAAQKMGKLPAFAERFVQELHKPRVNPWEILREHCKATMTSDYRWFPPNRRFVSQGLYLPNLRSEDAMGEMVVVIDTSGSIDNRTLQEFGNHISAIKADFSPERLHVIYADAAVNHVDTFERDDELVIKPHGGGGTDFRPAFRHLEKNDIKAAIVVYLTDLCGPTGDCAPGDYPVIWACTTDQVAPWGETIHIKV